mgnify:CR=1 FL=1
MSKERIVTQPLDDPIGSIYEIDGQCYVKTSSGDATMNHMILDENGQRCTDVSQIDRCETGSGQRKADVQVGGGSLCYGDISGIGNDDYTWGHGDSIKNQSWMAARDIPESERAAWHARSKKDNDPCQYINCQPPYRYTNNYRQRIYVPGPGPDPTYQYNSVKYCYVHRAGHVTILPKSTINGVDKIKFWAEGFFPFHNWRAVRWWVSLREKSTQIWHDTDIGYEGVASAVREARERGYTGDSSGSWGNFYNPRSYALGWALPVYDYRGIDAKFYDMPIDGVKINYRTGTQSRQWMHIVTCMIEKRGQNIEYLDSSISLRSTPSLRHYF